MPPEAVGRRRELICKQDGDRGLDVLNGYLNC